MTFLNKNNDRLKILKRGRNDFSVFWEVREYLNFFENSQNFIITPNNFQSELHKLQNQYESDFKIWKREHETAFKLRETDRENTIREQYRVERDRQIDTIIAKIDAETLKAQQDFDIKFKYFSFAFAKKNNDLSRNPIYFLIFFFFYLILYFCSRMKEKYEQEIKELENSEKNIKEKYIDTRTRLAEVEANNQNLQGTNKSMELQLLHLNKVGSRNLFLFLSLIFNILFFFLSKILPSKQLCEEFNREKDHLKDEARNEIKNELKSINREHESEIQRIYSRVQQAIHKKDATIEAIQKENGMLKERCLKLDAIIRQQRKDYCTKWYFLSDIWEWFFSPEYIL